MRRKVIKQGHNTLTITLPKRWANKNSVKAGEELEVDSSGEQLMVTPLGYMNKREEVSTDISNLDRTSIVLLIQTFYRFGYDQINIKTKELTSQHHRIEKKVPTSKIIYDSINRLIGTELISSTTKSYSIKHITTESKDEFDNILRRIFRLLLEEMNVFIEGIKDNNAELLGSIEFHHVNIKKFINFCMRMLNKFGYTKVNKTTYYYSLIQMISKIEDFIKNAARYTINYDYKFGKKAVHVAEQVQKVIKSYYDLYYDFDFKKVENLISLREKIRHEFLPKINNYSKQELIVLGGLLQINEVILDLVEIKIALEHQ